MKNKFWTIKNTAETADIYIYGDIVNYQWFESDTTAASFLEDLKSCAGKQVVLHINSAGGDVFNALAIANIVKAKNINVTIDGLCASAASLIAASGAKVSMAENGLIMLHLPSVGLFDFYDEVELDKIKNALSKTKDALITTYQTRMKDADIAALLVNETWYTAQEALEVGLVDEITPSVEMEIDNGQKLLFVNNFKLDISKIESEKFKNLTRGIKMADHKVDTEKIRNEIRTAELKRIKDLQGLKCENSAVNAIVDIALENGQSVDEIKAYVDALKKIPTKAAENATAAICAAITDNMQSGAQNVAGSQNAPDDKEIYKNKLIEFANGMV